MADDIVVDTNVFVQATNPCLGTFKVALRFVNQLNNSKVELCVDNGFSLTPSANRSFIGHEYVTHISPGSASFAVLVNMAISGRIKVFDRSVPAHEATLINRIVEDKTDRIFVRIARKSFSKHLISQDMMHFPDAVRRRLGSSLGVEVLEAYEYIF